MKGAIRKHKGSYEISIELPVGPDGHRRRHYERVRTKKEADRRLIELLASLDKGQPPLRDKVTVAQWITRWLEDDVKPRLRVRSYERYDSVFHKHIQPSIGHLRLTALPPLDIKAMLNNLAMGGLAPQA